ncbi:uncharacterized protein B0H18DRAFT_32169 [Fomitopsis serialis]|uniref:uncharacterized protein n=1 Tax=Fomitopsis serialis TaxID=139415 RepID=UPI002008AE8F|nr:uncharacterized protein B0H18DRAFT_32169 [Neoantrodia serialis]KAH9932616.1 hypothetical protein B0H18DRAFT_32169 [Neoantrodia serialis]
MRTGCRVVAGLFLTSQHSCVSALTSACVSISFEINEHPGNVTVQRWLCIVSEYPADHAFKYEKRGYVRSTDIAIINSQQYQ